jgi:hypothetical protein
LTFSSIHFLIICIIWSTLIQHEPLSVLGLTFQHINISSGSWLLHLWLVLCWLQSKEGGFLVLNVLRETWFCKQGVNITTDSIMVTFAMTVDLILILVIVIHHWHPLSTPSPPPPIIS